MGSFKYEHVDLGILFGWFFKRKTFNIFECVILMKPVLSSSSTLSRQCCLFFKRALS